MEIVERVYWLAVVTPCVRCVAECGDEFVPLEANKAQTWEAIDEFGGPEGWHMIPKSDRVWECELHGDSFTPDEVAAMDRKGLPDVSSRAIVHRFSGEG
jgi:hypothetical protein